jgi:translation initiation factor 2B subunit (eIF-2B alpha/beta/delta family)
MESSVTDVSTRETFNWSTKLDTNKAKNVTPNWNSTENFINYLSNNNNILMNANKTEFSTANETTNLPSELNTMSAKGMIYVSVEATVTGLSVEKTSDLNSGNFSDSSAIVNNLTNETPTSHFSTFETTNKASEKFEMSIMNTFEISSNEIKTTPANLLPELSTFNVDSNTSET